MQSELNVKRLTIKPFKADMFEELISIDLDYSENEDYYRDDTLELGFKNEAARCSKELSDEFMKVWQNKENHSDEYFIELVQEFVETACLVDEGKGEFLLSHRSYVSDYKNTLIFNNNHDGGLDYNEEITLVCSYVSH